MNKLAAAVCGLFGGAIAAAVHAGPGDGQVVLGTGTITQSGKATLIEQTSEQLAIDWQTFDLSADEAVRFMQPATQSVALNRIFDQNPSAIFGAIEANGRVYLMNPNGIVFGESARIDVGALLATSLDVPLASLGADRLELTAGAAPPGAIVNRGLLRAATGGAIALVGGTVANEGLIVADFGDVALGAGRRVTLDFDGDGLLYFEVDEELLANPAGAAAAIDNSGEIRADGGQVLMTARAAQGVFAGVVNNAGTIRAARIEDSGGVVRLVGTGGTVVTSGTIAAQGAGGGDTGGDVTLLGDRVGALGAADIDVSGAAGGGTIALGGGRRGAGDEPRSLYTIVAEDARLAADALGAGNGGTIAVWADTATWFRGTASARGGADGGDGGFVEISGREWLSFDGNVDTRAPQGRLGTLLFDPDNVTIVSGGPGADDAELPILSNAAEPTGAFEISEMALESVNQSANIVLEATGDIVMQDLADDSLDLATRNGSLTIAADTDGDGSGSFTMHASDRMLTEGADVTISGAAVTVGSIDVTGAAGDRSTGVITLASTGDVTVEGALTSKDAIAAAVDTDASGIATLRWRGSATAPDVQLTGGSDGNDVLEGGPGADAFAVTGAGSGTLNGIAFTDFGALSGAGGSDTLTARAVADAFTVTGAGAGNVNGLAFQSLDVLAGAGGADTFVLDADFGGALQGGAGADVFTVNASQSGTLDAGADADTVTLASGVAVATLTGGAGSNDDDTLAAGGAGANAWAVTALDAGTLNGAAFTAFGNLAGGAGADTFTFNAGLTGRADGNLGSDSFSLASGVAVGHLDGGADADTLALLGGAAAFTLTAANAGTLNGHAFSNVENLTGTAAADTFNLAFDLDGTARGLDGDDVFNLSAGSSAAIAGAAGNDTIVAAAGQPTTFDVTAADAGTITNGTGTVAFASVERLTGSNAADTFNLGANLTGTAAGGGGNDSFVVTASVTGTLDGGADADTVTLAPGVAIASLTGGAAGNDADTLAASGAAANSWLVSSQDSGLFNSQLFADFEHLVGGDGADTFTFVGSLSGTAAGGGGDDVFAVLTGSAAVFDGGAGSDFLSYAGSLTPVSLSGAAVLAAGIEIVAGSTSGSDVLRGGAASDTFVTASGDGGTLNGLLAYSSFEFLEGLGGNDTFTLNHGVSGGVAGGGGNDAFNVGNGVVVGAIDGGSGTDTLALTSGTATYVLTAQNAGTLNTSPFMSVENLTGTANADVFDLAFTLAGVADGLGGNDRFQQHAGASATIVGGGGSDTLEGDASAATQFNVSAANAGSAVSGAGTVTFTSVENLAGGAQADTFALNANLDGVAAGGGGDDAFSVAAGVTAALHGDAGNDTLQGSSTASLYTVDGANAGTVTHGAGSVTFAAIENLTAGAGDDTFNVLGELFGLASGGGGDDTFALGPNAVAAIAGNAGADTVAAHAATATTFTVNAANAGGIAAGSGNVAFTTIENLLGSAQADTFAFNGTLTGSAAGGAGNDIFAILTGGSAGIIDGGAGLDTQTYAGMAGPVTVGIGGFTSIESLIGTGDDGDTLLGTNAANTFATTGADAGSLDGIAYSSFEHLLGLGGDDTFALAHAVSGSVDGGTGNDAFTLAHTLGGGVDGGAGDDLFTFAAGASGAIAGGAGTDTLVAAGSAGSAGAHFDITAANAGTAALGASVVTFTAIENVTGGGGADTFKLGAALAGTAAGGDGDDRFEAVAGVSAAIDGGVGNDTLAADASTQAAFAVTAPNAGTLANGGGTVAFTAVESLTGSDAADTFALDAALAGTAAGGAGDDVFVLGPAAAGIVAGGAGDDLVRGAAAPTAFKVIGAATGSASAAGGTVELAEIETLEGGAANDIFTITANFAGAISGGGGDDRFELDANTSGSLAGDAGDDEFVVAADVTASGVLDGGAGHDTLDVASGSASRDVVLTAAGAVDGFDGRDTAVADFRNIDAVVGGLGSIVTGAAADATWRLAGGAPDTYTSGAATLDLVGFDTFAGGSAADLFVLETGNRPGSLHLDGGAGSDALEVAGALVLGGDLTVVAVESIAAAAGTELTAGTLRIVDASGGVGSPGAPLAVAIARLAVENGSGGLYLVDRSDGLEAAHVQLAGGDIDIAVERGDLIVGFVGTGGGTDFAMPPTDAAAGVVRLTAAAGSIERMAGAGPVHVRGKSAALTAFSNVGTLTAPLTIVVPSDATITLAGVNATINNPSLAVVDDSLIAGLFSDFTANATAAAVSVGAAAALQELATIDWAGLDPNVALVDCAAPCLLLPEDQREDDAFALLRDATKLLVIRHAGGWSAVPVVTLAKLPSPPDVSAR